MANKINVDTNALRTYARNISILGGNNNSNLVSLSTKINNTNSEISADWISDYPAAKERYVDKIENLCNKITGEICPVMENLSRSLKNYADQIEQYNNSIK